MMQVEWADPRLNDNVVHLGRRLQLTVTPNVESLKSVSGHDDRTLADCVARFATPYPGPFVPLPPVGKDTAALKPVLASPEDPDGYDLWGLLFGLQRELEARFRKATFRDGLSAVSGQDVERRLLGHLREAEILALVMEEATEAGRRTGDVP